MPFFKLKKNHLLLAAAIALQLHSALAQVKNKSKQAAADTAKKNSLAQQVMAKPTTGLKPYKEIVPATAKSMRGFLTVHLVNDRFLFELPDSVLNKDILIVSRINKGPVDFKFPLANIGYSGDETGKATISFEKVPGDKIALRSVSFKQFSNDTSANGLSRSLANSNYQTIQGVFPVKAVNTTSKSVVIDMTDFINGDNSLFAIENSFLRSMVGSLATDRSYTEDVKAFPNNIEVRAVKTYMGKPSLLGTPPPVTFEFNNSLVLLPANPMKPRLADPRIGYFSNTYVDFDANPYGVSSTKYIQRWRMEPKPEDMERYKKGELVEPQKPIVIYIDPATPRKWVPFLIQGINDWQVAFEKAGFKNAIVGKEVAPNDSSFSIDDARHSVLVYKPSEIANAMGPNINDPRTGEILETHISWYHSVMTLLQNWYTIQAGAIDARTHHYQLDDQLMGQLIRFVSSHEIGHTLGLMHNFGASSTVPVENLRNKAWVEAHGHTPSIMDYARFNYVAQPEDHITEKGIFPRIGDYDKWAVEWGYKLIPEAKTATDEKAILNQWLVTKLASGKQFFYGSQLNPLTNDFPLNEFDPRSQNEDLGDDAMLAGTYGIKNLQRIKPNIYTWFRKPGENDGRAVEVYKELVNQYGRYMGHVLKNVGGLYQTPKTTEQPGNQESLVPKSKQQQAIAFLQKQLFATPTWLKDEKLYGTGLADFNIVKKLQNQVLLSLLGATRINLLVVEESQYGTKAYTATEMLTDLKDGIFAELKHPGIISLDRRDLQKTYVEALLIFINNKTIIKVNDSFSVVRAHARQLENQLSNSRSLMKDAISRAHLDDLRSRLHNALENKAS